MHCLFQSQGFILKSGACTVRIRFRDTCFTFVIIQLTYSLNNDMTKITVILDNSYEGLRHVVKQRTYCLNDNLWRNTTFHILNNFIITTLNAFMMLQSRGKQMCCAKDFLWDFFTGELLIILSLSYSENASSHHFLFSLM